MLEAQEMFRTENKVTRPEKALILGFMAGSRYELYCCVVLRIQLSIAGIIRVHIWATSNIVTIKLSENQENMPRA